MVWGAIFNGGISHIFQMNRDLSGKKKGYPGESYLEVLKAELPDIYQNGWIFIQDKIMLPYTDL